MEKNKNLLLYKLGIGIGLLLIVRISYLMYVGISLGYFKGTKGRIYYSNSLGYYAAFISFIIGIILVSWLINLALKLIKKNRS